MPLNKPTEVVRIEYNALGEREKVRKIIPDPRSTLQSKAKRSSPPPKCSPRPLHVVNEDIDETTTRLEHTTNALRELLWGKIVRDDAGVDASFVDVAREYFCIAFGVEVGNGKMASLKETAFELQEHSSFLRLMGRALMAPGKQDSLGPGQSAVLFSLWSLLVEEARAGEEEFLLNTRACMPLSAFMHIFNEACNRHLSVPPALQESIKSQLKALVGKGETNFVDDLLEQLVEVLESNDRCCLETESLLFSKSALPQNVLLPSNALAPFDIEKYNASMLASFQTIKLLLHEFILYDEERDGILPSKTIVSVLLMWQAVIVPAAFSEDEDAQGDKARRIAQCFLLEEDEEVEEAEAVDYIELIALAHERVFEAAKVNSIEDLVEAVTLCERGIDRGTYHRLQDYVGHVILDGRKRLGRIVEDRLETANARASRVPKSYELTSESANTTPSIYLTEQLLYTEGQRTAT